MKAYYLLYLPALFFFCLPIVNILVQERKAKAAAREKEECRCAAAELKAAEKAKRDAARERASELKKTSKEVTKEATPKRKPGRPRKNPAEQRSETISKVKQCAAPVRVADLTGAPAPLPTSCTPEQFAAWIK